MDKVLRYFTIKDENFYMYSRVEGEFGSQLLVTYAGLSAQPGELSIAQQTSIESAPPDMSFRIGEMQYFLSVFQFFNPKFKVDYGLQETQQDSSS